MDLVWLMNQRVSDSNSELRNARLRYARWSLACIAAGSMAMIIAPCWRFAHAVADVSPTTSTTTTLAAAGVGVGAGAGPTPAASVAATRSVTDVDVFGTTTASSSSSIPTAALMIIFLMLQMLLHMCAVRATKSLLHNRSAATMDGESAAFSMNGSPNRGGSPHLHNNNAGFAMMDDVCECWSLQWWMHRLVFPSTLELRSVAPTLGVSRIRRTTLAYVACWCCATLVGLSTFPHIFVGVQVLVYVIYAYLTLPLV